MVDRTGGTVVLGDSFSMHIFQQSFKKMFEPDEAGYLQMGFNAKMNVHCSRAHHYIANKICRCTIRWATSS